MSASGTFTINNNRKDYLSNLSTLNFTTEAVDYVTKSYDIGFNFVKKGIYSIQTNFNIANHDSNGDFDVKILLSANSAEYSPYPLTYNAINRKIIGPNFVEYKGISFCTSRSNNNGGSPYYDRYQQIGQNDIGGYLSPLVVLTYQCNSNASYVCSSNYYTFSYIIEIKDENIENTYFIQTAFNTSGTYMNGSGNFYITYLGIWN